MAKRKFYNNREYYVNEQDNTVVLSKEFHNKLLSNDKWNKFKKLGGSSVPDVLETDRFKSQFSAFCHISRIKMNVLQKKYINAGSLIEPIVFNALRSKFPNLEILNYRAEDYDYDFFKDKDDILSGVPDGFIPSQNLILEIKTVGEAKYDAWEKEVPIAYKKQAQLYAYLMGVDKYSIVATFLRDDEGDYLNPEKYPIDNRIVKNYTFKINENETKDDIEKIKAWYKKYTALGISPQYNLSTDSDLVEYLKCSNETEWELLLEKWKKLGKADLDVQP
ncbi:MAGa7180 family putative nuclease [Mycoplasmopsis alligatoris]|uniref:YqaJ viral recombinase domain-containing protein n=1 Tax=Mycoplasmopsis alligatoris A21JP2 TaxID=747682 RepID=D4XV82_9BACT|nr:YqaJ viral recombinase family protein [Mycoplasmopsis alligatoris]EFF41743.1 conserved hypothetical protein [Mycoplasmopsis alligatoris A21JP2]